VSIDAPSPAKRMLQAGAIEELHGTVEKWKRAAIAIPGRFESYHDSATQSVTMM